MTKFYTTAQEILKYNVWCAMKCTGFWAVVYTMQRLHLSYLVIQIHADFIHTVILHVRFMFCLIRN